ncbi:MAG: YbjN domain-containing protein [Desulfitobacterium hafniense]|nr:YbjN domain-containing protein [Desulfitobacterium hafniense]
MKLFNLLYEFLVDDGWEFEFDDRNEIFRLEVSGLNSEFICFIIADEEQESLICNTYIHEQIPFHKRSEICEFMNRLNYELANGNFEMDMEDGEVRFRTYLDLEGSQPSKEQVLNLIWTGSQIFDTYFPGFMKIINEDYTSLDAVKHCTPSGDLPLL